MIEIQFALTDDGNERNSRCGKSLRTSYKDVSPKQRSNLDTDTLKLAEFELLQDSIDSGPHSNRGLGRSWKTPFWSSPIVSYIIYLFLAQCTTGRSNQKLSDISWESQTHIAKILQKIHIKRIINQQYTQMNALRAVNLECAQEGNSPWPYHGLGFKVLNLGGMAVNDPGYQMEI